MLTITAKLHVEGDLYEDGLHLKNGFFRTRHFAKVGSEASVDLFSDGRNDINVDDLIDSVPVGSQAEAMKRKERLEKEEFIRKCHVCFLN